MTNGVAAIASHFFSWTVVFYILCLHLLDDYIESLIKPDFFARFCPLEFRHPGVFSVPFP
ncbi:hypothetical protein AB434_3108 [Heyndrickxia coagulans]|uniref:Uncharacterized protein n=1 Tax=Heyndrickxia coagulans TaxID=1398 RepID=A0AAN0WBM6_HEYCO|nr:hypothetical protein SB48_HM08orf03454 [Heyndrickxia coagulans]KGT37550.1 hypothetical protein P421_14585 [Heyndrickxia coagulans P38]AKN55513.1 hypothetical protein AB434_3108 [Heyndrickxia coagulans]ATW83196.1 hypothetical protein CIW84_09490 [Heyndrickxia coagulans]KGB28404.1 hypothetical protein IE89_17680 [Heyndrickxia coagulans]